MALSPVRRFGSGVPSSSFRSVFRSSWRRTCSVLGMSKLLRGLAAGYGAKKLGGGCLGTILVFIVLWYLLGHFEIFR